MTAISPELRAFQPHLWGQTYDCDECVNAKQADTQLAMVCGPVEIVEDGIAANSLYTRLKLRWPHHPHDGHVVRIFTADQPQLLARVYRSTTESVFKLYKDPNYILPLCQECLSAGLAASIRPTNDWLYILRDDAAHLLISLGDDISADMRFHVGHAVGQHTDLDMRDSATPAVKTTHKITGDALEKLRYRAFFGDIVAQRKLRELGDGSSWK